jgi:lipopolysaccharide transport system permease protein
MSLHNISIKGIIPPSPLSTQTPLHRIKASKGWVSVNLRELWPYRELLYFLVWRDIKVRYKQTALGAVWAIIQPLTTMLVFSLFFGRLAKMPSDGIPYPLFSFAALVPWSFFSSSVAKSSDSLVGNSSLIKKVYFPRLLVPIAGVLSGLIDLLLALSFLGLMMAYYHVALGGRILYVPMLLLLEICLALGVGLWLSSLNIQYRDVRHILPFLIQFWMFATPIAYPSSLLHEPWRTVYGLNPMVGVIEAFRWALLNTGRTPGMQVLISVVVTTCLLVSGVFVFRRMEKFFADLI